MHFFMLNVLMLQCFDVHPKLYENEKKLENNKKKKKRVIM
jgi:hypothetical protein